jgi:hypothetical protein
MRVAADEHFLRVSDVAPLGSRIVDNSTDQYQQILIIGFPPSASSVRNSAAINEPPEPVSAHSRARRCAGPVC